MRAFTLWTIYADMNYFFWWHNKSTDAFNYNERCIAYNLKAVTSFAYNICEDFINEYKMT